MGKLRPFVRKDSYMPNKKWIPFVIGNGYTTTDGASGPAPEYETVTGNPVSFNAITPFPLRQLKVAFSPVQEGSGDPSPDNVRPISGWSSLTVEQTGVNLWNPNRADAEHGYYNEIGVFSPNNAWVCLSFPCSEGISFTKSGSDWGGLATFWLNGSFVSSANATSITVPSGVDTVRFACKTSSTNAQLELGSSASSYQPYNPSSRSISISLGQTVYSGWVDVVTGVMTVNMAHRSNFEGIGWNKVTADGVTFFYMSLTDGLWANDPDVLCSMYPTTTTVPMPDMHCRLYGSTSYGGFSRFAVRDDDYINATPAEFAEHMKTAEIAYTLREPFTIQLTPQEVESLAGDNNLWSDANQPLTVTYRSN